MVVRKGEAASADMKAAEEYLKTFAGMIAAKASSSRLVFKANAAHYT